LSPSAWQDRQTRAVRHPNPATGESPHLADGRDLGG